MQRTLLPELNSSRDSGHLGFRVLPWREREGGSPLSLDFSSLEVDSYERKSVRQTSIRLAAIPHEAEPQKPRPKERKRRGFWYWYCFRIRNGGGGDIGIVESEGRALGYQGRAYWSCQRTTGIGIGYECSGKSRNAEGRAVASASTRVAVGQDVADAASGLGKRDRGTGQRYERAARAVTDQVDTSRKGFSDRC